MICPMTWDSKLVKKAVKHAENMGMDVATFNLFFFAATTLDIISQR